MSASQVKSEATVGRGQCPRAVSACGFYLWGTETWGKRLRAPATKLFGRRDSLPHEHARTGRPHGRTIVLRAGKRSETPTRR
jgi:hypothetical protein